MKNIQFITISMVDFFLKNIHYITKMIQFITLRTLINTLKKFLTMINIPIYFSEVMGVINLPLRLMIQV